MLSLAYFKRARPGAAIFSNTGWHRTAGFFIACTIVFFALIQLPLIREFILTPLAVSLTWTLNGILHVLGEPVYRLDTLIVGPVFNMEITPACTGLYQVFFLWTAILCWPAAGRARLAGIVCGGSFLTTLNIIRILWIYYFGSAYPSWIPFFHNILWEGIMIVMVPVIWLIWIRTTARRFSR